MVFFLLAIIIGFIYSKITVDDAEGTVSVSNADNSLLVHKHGAQILSWKLQNKEQLFVLSTSKTDNDSIIDGGVPIMFPQFDGNSNPDPGKMPFHGFARNVTWKLDSQKEIENGATLVFTLSSTDLPDWIKVFWDFEFLIIYTIDFSYSKSNLGMKIQVTNKGTKDFEFDMMFHNYVEVSSIDAIKISGLGGLSYVDMMDGKKIGHSPKEKWMKVDSTKQICNCFKGTRRRKKVCIKDGKRSFCIKRSNFNNVNIWNPASGNNGDDYKHFVALEAGTVGTVMPQAGNPVHLKPSKSWLAHQTFIVK